MVRPLLAEVGRGHLSVPAEMRGPVAIKWPGRFGWDWAVSRLDEREVSRFGAAKPTPIAESVETRGRRTPRPRGRQRGKEHAAALEQRASARGEIA
jgi:hypothetical protein